MTLLFCCTAYVGLWHTAAEALATQCPELAEEADISPKWGNSRLGVESRVKIPQRSKPLTDPP